MISNRIRHWVVPVRSNTTGEVSPKDDRGIEMIARVGGGYDLVRKEE